MQSVTEQEQELAQLQQEIAALRADLAATAPPVLCKHHHKPIMPHIHPIVHTPGRCCYCGSPMTPPPDKGLIVVCFAMASILALVCAALGIILGGICMFTVTGLGNLAWMALGFASLFAPDYTSISPHTTLMFRIGAWGGAILGLFLGFVYGCTLPNRDKDGKLWLS